MGDWGHLTKRFLGSLRPGGPSSTDTVWVTETLSPAELGLWQRMYGPDRRHSVQVARDVQRSLGAAATSAVLAAALLHDVGKLDAKLRTYGRVVATMTMKLVGRDEVVEWRRAKGMHRRIALYALHPSIGADMLAMASSDPLTVAWTREHHNPRETWTVERQIADVLDACDND